LAQVFSQHLLSPAVTDLLWQNSFAAMKNMSLGCMQGLSLAACTLLLLSVIFCVVGLTGTWGSASFNVLGLVSGNGDFTLWDIIVTPEIPVIGVALPQSKHSIDATLCHHLDGLTKVDEVCEKLHGIRIAMIVGIVCAVLADLCASVAFASSLARSFRERMPCATSMWLLFAAACAFLTSLCAVVALCLALSMPDSEKFQQEVGPGVGSICTALLILFSLWGMAFEIVCWRAATKASACDMPAGKEANMNKAAHSAEDAC